MFWVITVYFNIRNTLLKSGTFLLGHPVYTHTYIHTYGDRPVLLSYVASKILSHYDEDVTCM